VHVWSIDDLESAFAGNEMLHGYDLVCCESAQNVRQPQGFRITLGKYVISKKSSNRFNSLVVRILLVDVQSEGLASMR